MSSLFILSMSLFAAFGAGGVANLFRGWPRIVALGAAAGLGVCYLVFGVLFVAVDLFGLTP